MRDTTVSRQRPRIGGADRRPAPLLCLFYALGGVLFLGLVPEAAAEPPDVVIRAARLYVGNGRVVEDGAVAIREGKISEVGAQVASGAETTVIEVAGASITPGLIDANARLEPADVLPSSREASRDALLHLFGGGNRHAGPVTPPTGPHEVSNDGVCPQCGGTDEEESDHLPSEAAFASGVRTVALSEQSSEVIPHTRILDALDLGSPDFQRLARGGVTTVYASPDSSAVVGSRGAILKTAGPPSLRIVSPAAAVKAVMGSDPARVGSSNRPARYSNVSLYTRRPTTRMGTTWVFRKAFYDTLARRQGRAASGADTPSEDASAVLLDVLDKKVPLRIQARTLADITTAVRLSAEFNLHFVLEEGTEAHGCLDLLRAHAVPVIYGPIEIEPRGLRRLTNETRHSRLHTLRALLANGVTTALSAQDLREEDGLARQAMYAMRFGLDLDEALKVVTSTPARILGIEDQVGTLESGKHADLVVWSGVPFSATSFPVLVMVSGEVVVDRRR